jgi:acetolactate synthase-1/2/3 large subunit
LSDQTRREIEAGKLAVAKAAAAIKAASRPVIVAEHTAEICGARDALARLAERIQAPVVATLDAKAIMAEDHPLFRGMLGSYGRSCANHVVAEADLVIYAGGNTSDQSTANWKIPKEGTRSSTSISTRPNWAGITRA